MTNRQFYNKWFHSNFDKILAGGIAKVNNQLCFCNDIVCDICDFCGNSCSEKIQEWLNTEAINDWQDLKRGAKVRYTKNHANDTFTFIFYDTVDNIIIVKDEWRNKYFELTPDDLEILPVEEN